MHEHQSKGTAKSKRQRGVRLNINHMFEVCIREYGADWERFRKAVPNTDFDKSDLAPATFEKARSGGFVDTRIRARIGLTRGVDPERLKDLSEIPNPDVLPQHPFESASQNKLPFVISLVSSKGGVGKTTLSVNLAVELANRCNVALIDADLFTIGATKWFARALDPKSRPMSLLSLGLGDNVLVCNRNLCPIKVDPPTSHVPSGNLYFVPAYSRMEFNEANYEPEDPVPPPIFLDWKPKETRKVFSRVLERLARLNVDVVIFDSHPGYLDIVKALCSFSDTNILVSDSDANTMRANWLMAAEIRRKEPNTADCLWLEIVNRIPTLKDAMVFKSEATQAREQALAEWRPFNTDSNEMNQIRASLLDGPAPIGMANVRFISPTKLRADTPLAFQKRGGTLGSLVARHVLRTIADGGLAKDIMRQFEYTHPDNKNAANALENSVERTVQSADPEWTGKKPAIAESIPLMWGLIFGLLMWETYRPDDLGYYMVALPIDFALLGLFIYALVCLTKRIIRIYWSFEQYWQASSFAELPIATKLRLSEAGEIQSLELGRLTYLVSWMGALMPGYLIAGINIVGLGDVRMAICFVLLSVLFFALGLSRTKGKWASISVITMMFRLVLRNWFVRLRSSISGVLNQPKEKS